MKLFAPKREFFPDPRHTLSDGLVTIGDRLDVETLLEAYSFGIFPWPQEELPVLWFSPMKRGVLDFHELHLPKSFKKFRNKTELYCTMDQNFRQVIQACSEMPRPGQDGTWILPDMVEAYVQFHEAGYAHSIECWKQDELVGGLYGVYVGGVFSGESMFFKTTGASKLCFIEMVEFLMGHGLAWMDIQMVTPVTKAFGGKYIKRSEFLERLEHSKKHAFQIW